MARTRKKYSKRKYNRSKRRFKSPRTNRKYTKRKYTKRKYTKRKYTKNKTKRRLRGGVKETDKSGAATAAGFSAELGPEHHEFEPTPAPAPDPAPAPAPDPTPDPTPDPERDDEDDDVFFDALEEQAVEEQAVEEQAVEEQAVEEQPGEGILGEEQLADWSEVGVVSGDMVAEGSFKGWYIRTGAPEAEKKGRQTTEEMGDMVNDTIINYTKSLEGDHNWLITNFFVQNLRKDGIGIYREGQIFPAEKVNGRYRSIAEGEPVAWDKEFRAKYHIRVGGDAFTITTDFGRQKYIIKTAIDPDRPLVLDFDTLVGQNLTIDKYAAPTGIEDKYSIAMTDDAGMKFKSDISWSQFEKMVKECLSGVEKGLYTDYTNVVGCQKLIQEIQDRIEEYHSPANLVALTASSALKVHRAAFTVAAKIPSLAGLLGSTEEAAAADTGAAAAGAAAAGAAAADTGAAAAGAAAAGARGFDGKQTITATISDDPLPHPSEKNLGKRRFMIASIGRLIKCGFLQEIYKQLALYSKGTKGGTGEGSDIALQNAADLGFMGAAMRLASYPTGVLSNIAKGAAGRALMISTQTLQNIIENMVPTEWIQIQGEIQKELLYEQMCKLEPDDKAANAIRILAQFAAKAGPESVRATAKSVERGASAYQYGKRAVSAAAWWASLTPVSGAWKGASLAYYVLKIKANNNEASTAARNLWDILCMILAGCETGNEGIDETIRDKRTLAVFSQLISGEITMQRVLNHAKITNDPLYAELVAYAEKIGARSREGAGEGAALVLESGEGHMGDVN